MSLPTQVMLHRKVDEVEQQDAEHHSIAWHGMSTRLRLQNGTAHSGWSTSTSTPQDIRTYRSLAHIYLRRLQTHAHQIRSKRSHWLERMRRRRRRWWGLWLWLSLRKQRLGSIDLNGDLCTPAWRSDLHSTGALCAEGAHAQLGGSTVARASRAQSTHAQLGRGALKAGAVVGALLVATPCNFLEPLELSLCPHGGTHAH